MSAALLPPLHRAIERPHGLGARRILRAFALVRDGQGLVLARLLANRFLMPPVAALVSFVADAGALRAVVSDEGERPVVIVCSTTDWGTPHRHRPQHLASALARRGLTVFYVTARAGYDTLIGIRRLAPHLYLADLTPEVLAVSRHPTVLLLSTDVRITQGLVSTLRAHGARLVYDYIDAFDAAVIATPISDERCATHRLLLRDEDVFTVASARVLYDEVRGLRSRNVALVPNGVDCAHFAEPRCPGAFHPAFRAALARGRPIVGFYGLFASWVDVDLLAEVARRHPGLSVVAIGADFDGTLARLTEPRPANLFLVPSVPYAQLPRYAAWFDVSALPFREGAVAEAASPLKLYEYMALGRPIVSTPIPEACQHECVSIARDRADFVEQCGRALSGADDPLLRRRLIQEARANSWDVRAERLAHSLEVAGFLTDTDGLRDRR